MLFCMCVDIDLQLLFSSIIIIIIINFDFTPREASPRCPLGALDLVMSCQQLLINRLKLRRWRGQVKMKIHSGVPIFPTFVSHAFVAMSWFLMTNNHMYMNQSKYWFYRHPLSSSLRFQNYLITIFWWYSIFMHHRHQNWERLKT